ncbi:uncharacterized protein LOC129577851 [Sitodiplosis mosellana]|uniref:uncharacterized protein LOC129577851 n=1 Tax=Sitodiplosis mosellana TaxID=263140 RepID=UPI002443C87F|nr:uncharacterized protein LOC129577851 [Sitodiplosis mosellana]XP_055321585.1 uncharacterized protein LOC129577851 [Sitodiplosis mosellana]
MLKLFAYFVFTLCLHLVRPMVSINDTRPDVQRSFVRHNSHLHHHHHQHQNHQLIPTNRYNPNTRTKNRIDVYTTESRTWNLYHNAHDAGYGNSNSNSNSNSNRNRNKNKTQTERLPSVNTKLQSITSKSPTKSLTNPLKLTLIQTNGHSFVANNYPDAFNTHRWPIAPQSPSTDYDIKWRTANNPFALHSNPGIESVPISTAPPMLTTTTITAATAAAATTMTPMTMPTAKVYRAFTEHRMHTKHHQTGIGRHVCVDYKSIITPAIQQENRQQPCKDDNLCEIPRLNYDNFNTILPRRIGHTVYSCCPGWSKVSKHSHGCTKPICKTPCKNNGKCVKPESCSCQNGYTGRHCELDVNECETEKPCDQMCYNTDGSFYCTCRLGFILHSDRQSCKKIDSSFGNDDTGTAFEARDLENDVDSEDLVIRMNNIEKLMITEKERNVETNKLMHHTLAAVNNLKHRLDGLENRQHELSLVRERLKTFEIQANKLQYTVDLLYKCHHKPLIYCPQ